MEPFTPEAGPSNSTRSNAARETGAKAGAQKPNGPQPLAQSYSELLECGVCLELMVPPIYQCTEGHTLCSTCQQKVKVCPTCRCQQVDVRCRALERLAESIGEVACKYASFGCKQGVSYMERSEHEKKCAFRPLECLHYGQGCTFEGNGDDLVRHLVEQHGYEQREGRAFTFTCTRENATPNPQQVVGPNQQQQPRPTDRDDMLWQRLIISSHGKHFVLRVHRKSDPEPQYFMSLAVLHARHHCNRYTMSVAGNHRKYIFEGPTWSVKRGLKEVERVRDCLIIPENIALFLSGGKGSENDLSIINLTVAGEIL